LPTAAIHGFDRWFVLLRLIPIEISIRWIATPGSRARNDEP